MKIFIKVALLMALTLTTSQMFAQKSARINVQTLVMSMPETMTMQETLEALRQDSADNLETMQVELNTKVQDYQQNAATMNESIRSMKEKEMQDLSQRMQQFEQSAMQELQAKQTEMLDPILMKARDAIAATAKAGGYQVVYDESAGALAYYDEVLVVDITADVKRKLGMTE